jgi:hypothetical protein
MNIYINDLNLKLSAGEKQVLADCSNFYGNGGRMWFEKAHAELLGVTYAIKCLKKLIASAKKVSVRNKYKAVAMSDAKIAQGIIDKLTEAHTEFKKEVKRVNKEYNSQSNLK